ncbi:MAG: FAD-dependent thymidylate synthase [Candidatus Aminicenantes bacterium]|nr:FAD-dependent thymidylate synthase [Candidatus Aminicenantes bacterium]
MKVILAGYNIDSTVIEELKKLQPGRLDVTPETLSAAYARISRDPRSAEELRAVARQAVDKARRSNKTIIFKMGHHSVAEHAVFNFDIIGVSRLAIEEIERFRLGSYTEKSQRYIKLQDEFRLPKEIIDAGKKTIFIKTIKEQNRLYHELYDKLRPYFFDKCPAYAQNPKKHSILDGWAKEDARYAVSLATQGQLGLTMNARSLEYFIRRLASKKLDELKELNQKIYTLVKEVAPSIILFTEADDFNSLTYDELKEQSASLRGFSESPPGGEVQLAEHTLEADIKLIASLMHTTSLLSYSACFQKAKKMNLPDKIEYLKTAFEHMEFYDFVLREFEYIDLVYELVVSATCFAQLKRHRMATLCSQEYDPSLGVKIPPSVEDVGMGDKFMICIERTNDVYTQFKNDMKLGAEYILTNAHRKRVLLKVNARELYHISRLREDPTAQWDIRNTAEKMSGLAKEKMPLTFMLLGSKAAYPQIYRSVFGKPPKLIPPEF